MRWKVGDPVNIDQGEATIQRIVSDDIVLVGIGIDGIIEIDINIDYIRPRSDHTKYKPGDIVRVVRSLDRSTDDFIGRVGIVVAASAMLSTYPYSVKFQTPEGIGFSDLELALAGVKTNVVTKARNIRGSRV